MYTGGGGLVCECTVECALGVQLSEIVCLTEKPLQCTLNRRLLQVAGAFYKRSTLSYDKKSFRNPDVKKASKNVFLFQTTLKINF